MGKFWKYKLLGIFILGLVMRLIAVNQSLWLDEATTALASKMSVNELFTKFLPGDFHPPLYYLLMKGWTSLFSFSEIALRIPSVIFGVATIYFVYLIARKLYDTKIGIIASILVATSGLLIYYSQEARMYSLAAMLVTLSVFLFLKKKWPFFGICLAVIELTDYVALFIVPVFLFLSLKDIKKMALSLIPLFISFGLWMPIFIQQLTQGVMQKGSAWWNILGTPTIKNILLIPTKFIFGRIGFDNKFLYGVLTLVVASLFVFLLFKARSAGKTIWYWLTLPIIVGVLISLKIPTLSYFRFLFCLPALYILLAYGIGKIEKHKYIFLALVIVINIFSSGYYLFNKKFQREDWRGASAAVGTDEIILPGSSQKEALIYYGKGGQIVKDPVGSTIWLSRYVWEISDPDSLTENRIKTLGYNKTAEYDFNGVVFWKYNKLDKYANSY